MLTMLRIVLIPVFIVFASDPGLTYGYLFAGIVFVLASYTDYLDGAIARKRNLVTDFGKFADPLADKILTTTAFLYMMADGACHVLVLVIILAREFAVSGVRMVAAGAKEGKVIAANLWGKLKTVFQMITISFYYLLIGAGQVFPAFVQAQAFAVNACNVLCWLVAALTAFSGAQYIWSNRSFITVK